MFINKKEKFSIRKFKDGRSDSVKIGTVGLIVGAALAMAGQPHIAEAAMTENSDNTTTISNDKGSVIVDTANIENPDAGRAFSTDPTAEGTNTITKTGKVDYKYVTAEGNTVLEENKNQNSGADKTIETTYDVYGKSGEVFKGTTGGDAEDSDLNDAKENGKKETIEKDGKTYHLIGEPKVETTGNGGGVYSDTTLGDVTAKLTPEGLSNAEGKITYDTVKPGGKAWIVEQTGKGTYGKYVQADSGAITSDAKMIEAFKAGEATAKNFNSANVTADGGIKEGDYVFVLEKNTYVTAKTESFSLTAQIQLSSSDNVADDKDGTGATLNRTYAMVQNFKAAPDTLTGEANKTLVKNYLAYLQEKGFEDNLLNFKRYITLGMAAKTGGPLEISADKGDQVDDKGRPTSDITADIASVTDQETSTLEDSSDFLLKFSDPSPEVEEYSYRDEITPLRAYRLASGTTTITYTYAEEKTREVEKKGSVVVNYQTEDGVELKAPYTDTPETVAEVVTEHYYVDADGQEVVVEDKTVRTPKNVAYNTKKNETEKPQKLTDAQGNVYYLKADATKTAVNDVEKDAPAEEGTVVEGVTKVTYIYEKAGSVIVNYKTVDGTALTGTVVDEDGAGKTVESGAKDIDNGKPGSAYNTADNGMKPTRIKTADGKVYQLESTEGQETGEVVAGETKEVTYVYKEVKGNVVVKYEDTEGNSLADDEQDETDASLDVKYDTADHKKDEITKDGVKYYLTAKELKDGSKPATGDVVEGTTTVTYVYEKAGQVVVNYQTEDGTPLVGVDAAGANVASGAKDTVDGRPGSDYNTADNDMKPTRITTAEGKVYELVPTATKGDETGKVVAGETKEVTYVYKEVTGDVVVHYVDTEGNVIAEDKEDTKGASLNAKYDTTDNKPEKIEKDGTVYYLTEKAVKDDSKPENGDVVEGKTEVTYVYEKAGQVVVHYTDDKGNTIQVDAVDTKDGKPNADYNTADNDMKPNRITTPEGKVYELIPQSTKGDETGKVKAGETTEVTYVYKEITGNVVVHYVDTEGNTLADDTKDVENGSLSEKYDTTDNKPAKLEKDGTVYYLTAKELKDGSKPENGAVVEGTTEITYVYEKAGNVLVHYVDEAGNTLQADAVDTKDGKPGAKYDTSDNDMKPTRITTSEGKVYELVPASTKGNETGDVEAGKTTEVTYVYKEVKGNVVVHYTDEAGNTIAEDVKDTTDGSVSSAYDTTDNKPAKLEKDGTVYYLTAKELKDGSKPENGAVVEGTTEITYVYEKAGNVLVHYVDEAGNTLQADAVDTKDGKPGAKYDTSDNDMKPTRITTPEGKVYELVPASTKGNETGDVEAGKTTEVTYVYKEVKGNVVVHYTDEAGNTIAEDVKDTTDGSVSSAYDTSDNKPATITTKDGKVYVLVPTATKGEESGKVTEGTTEVTYVYKDVKEEASKAIDKALSEKESKIKENPELTNEEKEKAIEDAKKSAEQAKKALEEAKTPEDVEKSTTKGKEDVEKTPVTPEDKPKAKEAIDKALENKVKKIDENPNLTPEQKEKAKEEAKKDAEEAKKAIDKAPSKEEVEKAKENGKKEVEKDTPTPDKPSTPSENDKDQPTTPSPEEKAKAKEAIDKALENKVKKIDENPNLTPEQKEKAKEEAKKKAEEAKKTIDKAPSKEEVEKAKENGKKEVEKDTPTPDKPSTPSEDDKNQPTTPSPEDKAKAKEAIDKALENKVKKIDENPNLTPEQKEKAKEEAKKDAEEAKKAIDKAPSKEEVEKAKENGKKEVEKDTPTPDSPSNPSTDNPTNPSEGNKDKPYTPSPEEKAKAKESVDKDLEEKIKNIDKDPNLTPEQKEKAKEEAKKEAEKVKKSIEEGKTTEWVDEKGNPIKPVTPGTYPAGSTPNYELVGTVTNKETGKVTHIFKPSTKKPVTVWVDVNGKPVKPLAEGDNPAGEIPGYALVETIKDEKTGNVIHVFKRTTNGGSLTPSQPGSPSTSSTNPTSPVKPTDSSQPTTPANPATPTMPSAPVNGKAPQAPAASSEAKGQAELPNTGTEDHASLAALGLLGVLSGFGLVARKKKED